MEPERKLSPQVGPFADPLKGKRLTIPDPAFALEYLRERGDGWLDLAGDGGHALIDLFSLNETRCSVVALEELARDLEGIYHDDWGVRFRMEPANESWGGDPVRAAAQHEQSLTLEPEELDHALRIREVLRGERSRMRLTEKEEAKLKAWETSNGRDPKTHYLFYEGGIDPPPIQSLEKRRRD